MPIVEAAMISATVRQGSGTDKQLSQLVEEAMSRAYTQGVADGITDPEEQKMRMQVARVTVMRAARGGV